jgi:hypothetical protein
MTEVFKANRPDLSQGSLRTYTSILKNVAKQMSLEIKQPSDVIKHYKDIIKHLEAVEPKARKTRLACLIVFIDKDESKEKEKAVESFRKLMTSDIEVYNKQIDKQELSERQKEGMMSMDEVMKKYNELEKEVAPLLNRESLTKVQLCHVQLYVLLSCLLLIPPRRSLDYTEFKIRNIDEKTDNYMKTEKKVPSFVFSTYKTAKKYGQQTEVIPVKLANIIKKWMKLNTHDYLLMNTKQTGKISPTQLTDLLYSFFEKPLSTSLLRHIYLSDKYKDLPALTEMKETAKALGHSVPQMLEYVKKDMK